MLHDSVFQMQVNDIPIQRTRVAENNRTNSSFPSPFPRLLSFLAWRSEGIESCSPGRIGALVEGWQRPASSCLILASFICIYRREGSRPQNLQRSRNRLAKMAIVQPQPIPRRFQHLLQLGDLFG